MRFTGQLLIVVVLLGICTAGLGVTAAPYTVDVSPAVPTPERNVSIGGESFVVDAIGRVGPGEPLEVIVSGPMTDYEIYLLDGQGQPQTFERESGNATVTFQTDGLPPGSYLVSINEGSIRQAIHPVIVPAYHVDVEAPSVAMSNQSIQVRASLEPVSDDESISAVVVAIGDGDQLRRVEMTRQAPQKYSTSISPDQLDDGDYTLTVGVRGQEVVRGRNGLIGLSDGQTLAIGTNGSAGADDGGRAPPGTSSAVSGTTNGSPSGASTVTSPASSGEEVGSGGLTSSATVITPNEPTPTQDITVVQDSSDVQLLLLAIALLLFLRRQ